MNYRNIELLVLIGIILLYSWATYERNFVWTNQYILWRDVAKKSPKKPRVRFNAGILYTEKGLYDQGISEIKEYIKAIPHNPAAHHAHGVLSRF